MMAIHHPVVDASKVRVYVLICQRFGFFCFWKRGSERAWFWWKTDDPHH